MIVDLVSKVANRLSQTGGSIETEAVRSVNKIWELITHFDPPFNFKMLKLKDFVVFCITLMI